jgi:hypothetical protein
MLTRINYWIQFPFTYFQKILDINVEKVYKQRQKAYMYYGILKLKWRESVCKSEQTQITSILKFNLRSVINETP